MAGRGPRESTGFAVCGKARPASRGGTRERHRTATRQGVARIPVKMHRMHMRRFLLTDEAKKKLWRPCREARALGL